MIACRGYILENCAYLFFHRLINGCYTDNHRRVKSLSLEGCSLLTTECLESVILSLKELQSLKVESCKNIKDRDISPALSTLFSVLIELKWRPDNRSHLPSSAMGKKGSRFFKRSI